MNLLKSFLIGSNGIIPLLFYTIYFNIPIHLKTVPNETYVLLVAPFFGLMNIFMNILQNYFTAFYAITFTTFVSSFIVFLTAYTNKVYRIHSITWLYYYCLLFTLHYIAYFILSYFNSVF